MSEVRPLCTTPSEIAVGYFPRLFPDELLYSGLGRAGLHTSRSCVEIHRDLFGMEVHRPSLGFPYKLKDLAEKIAVSTEHLIYNHTNFLYYTAFVPRLRVSRLVKLLVDGPDRRNLSAHPSIVSPTPGLPPKPLRFCEECMEEAERSFGVRYWRRLHQIPLVLICPEHGCVLRESLPLNNPAKFRFHPASREVAQSKCPAVVTRISSSDIDELLKVAKDCEAMSRGDYPEVLPSRSIIGVLKRKFLSKGYGTEGRVVSWEPVCQHIIERFDWMARSWPPLFDASGAPGVWLATYCLAGRKLTRRTELMQLAGYIADSLPARRPPFGSGPWICVNPLSNHCDKMVVRKLIRVRQNMVNMGRFICECGYEYVRSENDEGERTKPLLRRMGPKLIDLMNVAVAEGWHLSRTAQAAGVNPQTLRSMIEAEGYPDPFPRNEGQPRDERGFRRVIPDRALWAKAGRRGNDNENCLG